MIETLRIHYKEIADEDRNVFSEGAIIIKKIIMICAGIKKLYFSE